jgi:hypothetical protein
MGRYAGLEPGLEVFLRMPGDAGLLEQLTQES